ncbi:S-layer homology domain-containing protein [Clostridium estertheticum]|uniref:S-layer homology domain-containing protein n=2 Tax=Clostridium estertheticum TaxID=238834 RepID=UPI001C7E0450|nr:S-layer homology domain-containing protein [Clostridium estertheticum]MBX4263994.1 S-layer homology domain-containing protein [Clostridium estertheticum]MBX4268070.1 S-layer homology domain-containing protein [Clostridium estertheticum]WLC87104.1 S-layer homology domain-containing protein [Clostridium estertheticum]
MKFRKATMSVFLIFTFFMSTISSNFASAVTVADYSGGVARMKQLGIVNAAVVSNAMNRGQFVKSVVIAADLEDAALGMRGATIFPDIKSDSEMSGYVNILLNKGLISGMADGNFHPEIAITYQEICTVIVKLLGYVDGDLVGTYPSNYISKAKTLGITDDLSYQKGDRVTYRAVAVMFDRLLDTDIKASGSATTAVTYSDSIKLYSDCIVQDNSESYDKLAKNEVLTDKGVFNVPANVAKLQVGATYRIKLENEGITKVYGKVREPVSITANTIVGNVVNYNEDGTTKSMILPSSIIYYYHGVKEAYTSVSSLLKANSSIVFDYNTKVSSSYAVIIDPIYSDPELASNIDVNSDTLGNIVFNENTKIIKNGQAILKRDIKDTDVVYSVTDLNGGNKYILAVENYVEGYITDIPADSNSLYDIQVDKVNYNYSDDMDITKLALFKDGDLVRLVRDKDDKVLDIKNIENKTGTLAEYIILGTSVTSDNLSNNEILTDKGTLQCLSGVTSPEVGAKYKLYVDGTIITKIDKKENTTENYAVTEKAGTDMKWENDKDVTSSIKLPKATVYYHNGEKVNYNACVNGINLYSSIMLSKNSANNGYEYAVIIDPVFSIPKVYRSGDTAFLKEMDDSEYSFVYSNEMYTQNTLSVDYNDVVYFVSDIWNKNRYIYASRKSAFGDIDAFTPNKINATSIKINGTTYEIGKYFDKNKLEKYYSGNFIKVILGEDGSIVDIY